MPTYHLAVTSLAFASLALAVFGAIECSPKPSLHVSFQQVRPLNGLSFDCVAGARWGLWNSSRYRFLGQRCYRWVLYLKLEWLFSLGDLFYSSQKSPPPKKKECACLTSHVCGRFEESVQMQVKLPENMSTCFCMLFNQPTTAQRCRFETDIYFRGYFQSSIVTVQRISPIWKPEM